MKSDTESTFATATTTNEIGLDTSISFLLRPPIDESEVEGAEEKIRSVIQAAWKSYKLGGVNGLRRHVEENRSNKQVERDRDEHDSVKVLQDAEIKGDARRYQTELFEIAKSRNTIICLGTGQGKTLIAIMLIRHFAHNFTERIAPSNLHKQTWFLVPSVALAVQQSRTLRANLPYRVTTACHTAACSAKARKELSSAQIIVATHGSALELMRHFDDLFSLMRVNLLVLDECHHAVKKHNYAVLMEKFYHPLAVDKRPHVVGLTASPIINVPKNVTDSNLEVLLTELETTLDAALVSLSTLGIPKEEIGVIESKVQEKLIEYNGLYHVLNYPPHDNIEIHKSRIKELQQLKYLYTEFGPAVVQSYTDVLINEISRNHYECESLPQHELLIQYLNEVRDYSRKRCEEVGEGKSGKLKKLEELLVNLYNIEENNWSVEDKGTVGIIFVERRITAVALKHYLCNTNTMYNGEFSAAIKVGEGKMQRLRCDLLTRQSTHVFKYLSSSHKLTQSQQQTAHDDWLHKMNDSRQVLDKLRRREVDVIICTSVVEEGVDVDACSFVIVLDDMKTTKGYIQMKGRARQMNAKFFVFENKSEDVPKAPVSLSHANRTESQITNFIGSRPIEVLVSTKRFSLSRNDSSFYPNTASDEDNALKLEEYHSLHAVVHLSSAKSLVNRYAMSVPMDINSRSSRAALQPYLPVYSKNILRLPSHLPQSIRCITLPPAFINNSKKRNHEMLALIACVRLHKLNILNDHLLPLKREDIHRRLMSSALIQLRSTITRNRILPQPPLQGEHKKVYIYPIMQTGSNFAQNSKVLLTGDRCLCIVSLQPMRSTLSVKLQHSNLGLVQCQLGSEIKFQMTHDEWVKCATFYAVIMNSRWRRRTGTSHFRYKAPQGTSIVSPYVVACMSEKNVLDWNSMNLAISNYSRTEYERKLAVEKWAVRSPRLWAPVYDPNNTYIAYNKEEGIHASSPFPDSSYHSFKDYFLETKGQSIAAHCPMSKVQRMWQLPNKTKEAKVWCSESSNKHISRESNYDNADDKLCCGLPSSSLLPLDLVMEAPFPDAGLYLHCVLLPQFLYELERMETVEAFISHCSDNFPDLGSYVDRIKKGEILEIMTAKSCGLSISYDRLEYLGDAVLKLLQTDALMYSKDENLRQWIHCLHEGDLTALRSAMGCNERLKEAAECAGIDSFILTRPLSRGQWVPNGLEAHKQDSDKLVNLPDFIPSEKVKADVIEALLGVIYIHFGYVATVKVAEELRISLPKEMNYSTSASESLISKELLEKASSFLAMEKFKNKEILLEATTHPSKIHSKVPSYQRLEWVGDAVLCLAAREWVYNSYPKLTVKEMVQIETTIICNETLALIGSNSRLCRYIDHCDSTLPGRLEKYELCAKRMRQGLWGTDPPKVLADVVEALLGVAHIDGGFKQGQLSAIFVIKPMTKAILLQEGNLTLEKSNDQRRMLITHPKQTMLELCETLKVKATPTHEYIVQAPSRKIWSGKSWAICSEKNSSSIGEVLWEGISLCALADKASHTVSKNRACALVSSILHKYPDLNENLLEMSEKMNKRK